MYQIICNDHLAGSAEVRKEGMYYRFLCRCCLPDKGFYRVSVADGRNQYDLGICVPDGNVYSCVARMKCSQLSCNNLTFTLSKYDEKAGIPLVPGKSFAHLDKLKTARLRYASGQPEIIIDSIQAPQDSDRNREFPNKWVQL